jgi:hypothetical protein
MKIAKNRVIYCMLIILVFFSCKERKIDTSPPEPLLKSTVKVNEEYQKKILLKNETGPKYLYQVDVRGLKVDRIIYIHLRYFDDKIGVKDLDQGYSINDPWEFRIIAEYIDMGFKDKVGNCYYGDVRIDDKELKHAFRRIYEKENNAKIVLLLQFEKDIKSIVAFLKTEKQVIRLKKVIDFSVEKQKCLETH